MQSQSVSFDKINTTVTSTRDKFKATWVSHSSISEFLKCPKAYYFANIYKNPNTNRKVTIINPYLSLGQIIHEVVESLSFEPVEKRFDKSLIDRFEKSWQKISGIKGGFTSGEEENEYKERGKEMLARLEDNPGPLLNKAIKINKDRTDDLPYYWLSEEDNIILCGKIDWLEYLPENNSVHIIDFKTGRNDESNDSLQLPIYMLLVANCQNRKISKVSYWYLGKSKSPQEMGLPKIDDSHKKILKVARMIKKARDSQQFECPKGGCFSCEPYEKIITGKAKFVGIGEYNKDVYIVS